MKKKLLIIGNDNSIYIKRYIENILTGTDFEIHLTSLSDNNGRFKDFYIENDVKIINLKFNMPVFKFIPKVSGLLQLLTQWKRIMRLKYKYNIVHIHFMEPLLVAPLARLNWFKGNSAEIIATFWGSDLFRVPDKTLKKVGKSFEYLKYITMNSNDLFKKFYQVYSHKYDSKLRMVRWGVATFDDISTILNDNSREDCKEFFGISKEKTVLSIGYNAYRAQQHLEALRSLTVLPSETWKNTVIVLPMTYGVITEKYKNDVMTELQKIGCEYKILDTFISDIDVAKLRLATDIFIHAQTTDALSGTMQEYLYAGSVVLNPSWITYDELHELGVTYIEYKDFNDLPQVTQKLLSSEIKYNMKNKKILHAFTSWESVKPNWQDLYA